MERVDEEGQVQESSCGTGSVGRTGAERIQAAGQQGERPWAAQEAVNLLIRLICARYGRLAIGRGYGGIRYLAAGQ
jgi:hypothetical protein